MPSVPENYAELNRRLWNAKTDYHLQSAFYNVPGFRAGESSLNELELGLLGDVQGQQVLHLQCHFGLDTLSLSRLGARVTGVDIADKAIARARELAAGLGLAASSRAQMCTSCPGTCTSSSMWCSLPTACWAGSPIWRGGQP